MKVIEVKNISKTYAIGTAAKDSIIDSFRGLFKSKTQPKSTFNALTDVSFDVDQGEVLGIVGKNGAGKSTLLKVLSRITEPTNGEIVMRGRVASLLEVGTGFHPELSGRENIFLNGSILGMTRAEIKSKFDEIVAFSGVEKFIDTPVKHYSSGMYVRLAFSVAAHLEPEILIIDEVLAVGDAEFQKKCLGKMKDVAGQGRTVLFVSHNMAAVKALCTRIIVLKEGNVITANSVDEGIGKYLNRDELKGNSIFIGKVNEQLDQSIYLTKASIVDKQGVYCENFTNFEEIRIVIDLLLKDINHDFKIMISVVNYEGLEVLTSFHNDFDFEGFHIGSNKIELKIPAKILNSGIYSINLNIGIHKERWILKYKGILGFEIDFITGNSKMLNSNKRKSIIAPILKWDKI